MPGLTSYVNSTRVLSAQVGYAILQSKPQGYLTDTQVQNAASADDLIANVNAAVVAPGAESPAQRQDIAKALAVGKQIGDLSDARVAAATSVNDLAVTYTWVSEDPNASVTGHLGPSFYS